MTGTPDLELAEGESLIVNPDELALRQITEWMAPDGAILTHVFGPSTADQGMPSYSRDSVVDAQTARDWHNGRPNGSRSVGVWAVSVEEVIAAGRHVIDDSAAPTAPDAVRAPGHCYVDFRGLPKPDVKSIRYLLWQRAMERGEIPTEEPLPDGQLTA